MKILPLALATTILLTGCSNLPSEKNLATDGNWEQLGLIDGQGGNQQRRPEELSGLAPADNQSVAQYRDGYKKGIEEFCTEDNAFFAGLSGRAYTGQCAFLRNEALIIESWDVGLEDYYESHEDIDD